MELKVDTLEKGIKREQEHSKQSEDRTKQLQELVENSKHMKTQWKQMTLDITSKLQTKINELHVHNRKLETENCQLKKSLMGTKPRLLQSDNTSSDYNGFNEEDHS